jgi:hypothetical protein
MVRLSAKNTSGVRTVKNRLKTSWGCATLDKFLFITSTSPHLISTDILQMVTLRGTQDTNVECHQLVGHFAAPWHPWQ